MSIKDEEKRLLGYKTEAAEQRLRTQTNISPTYTEDVVIDWSKLLEELLVNHPEPNS